MDTGYSFECARDAAPRTFAADGSPVKILFEHALAAFGCAAAERIAYQVSLMLVGTNEIWLCDNL